MYALDFETFASLFGKWNINFFSCFFSLPFQGGIDRRELYGSVHRPNLDGSSSDSDNDNNIQPTSSAAHHFARSSVQTSRFELQHELEDLNLQNIPGIACLAILKFFKG